MAMILVIMTPTRCSMNSGENEKPRISGARHQTKLGWNPNQKRPGFITIVFSSHKLVSTIMSVFRTEDKLVRAVRRRFLGVTHHNAPSIPAALSLTPSLVV